MPSVGMLRASYCSFYSSGGEPNFDVLQAMVTVNPRTLARKRKIAPALRGVLARAWRVWST
jgi:hypothetical protein